MPHRFIAVAIVLVSLVAFLDGTPVVGQWWEPTGSLNAARTGHTLTLLTSSKILVAGGVGVVATELYDPADGTWTTTGDISQDRVEHTATLLPSGKVFLVGGKTGSSVTIAIPELFDPTTGTWQLTGASCDARHGHTATLLRSGQVLLAGGFQATTALTSAEIYNPATGDCASDSTLQQARGAHTATLLPGSDDVLVIGGLDGVALASVERFTAPATWTELVAQPLSVARRFHTATLLTTGADVGKVLVAGGRGLAGSLSSVELYDPASGSTLVNPLPGTRWRHAAVGLPSGQVLVAGGVGAALVSTELYDPGSGNWTPAGDLADPRSLFPAILLPSGKALVAGGNSGGALAGVEIYEPAAGAWTVVTTPGPPAAPGDRFAHTAILLADSDVLVAGGHQGATTARVDLYDAATRAWTTVAGDDLPEPRRDHTATLLHSGDVLVAGGEDGAGDPLGSLVFSGGGWSPPAGGDPAGLARRHHTATLLPSGEVLLTGGADNGGVLATAATFAPSTGSWTFTTSPMSTPRAHHTATLLTSDAVLVAGGNADAEGAGGTGLASTELFDLATETWSATGSLPARRFHTATLLPSGKVLVAGGSDFAGSYLQGAQLYDPATGSWSATGSLNVARDQHAATLLSSGKVLVAGGETVAALPVAAVEVFDPATGTWTTVASHVASVLPTTTLLTTGEVLLLGEHDGGETYDPGFLAAGVTRPVITSITAPDRVPTTVLGHDSHVVVMGTGFDGESEAGSGHTGDSGVNHPLVQLHGVEDGHQTWVTLNPHLSTFGDDPLSLVLGDPADDLLPGPGDDVNLSSFFDLPPAINPGWQRVTVFTHGVPSPAQLVLFECSLTIDVQPASPSPKPLVGQTATFSVETRGARTFQWDKCHGTNATCNKEGEPSWAEIPGATAASYTTPPILAPDVGTLYRVNVASGCAAEISRPARLEVEDTTDPLAEVVAPDGGELWTLSEAGETASVETASWAIFDDVRVCKTELALLYSTDGGQTYPGRIVLQTLNNGLSCTHPGLTATPFAYTVPETPPSGEPGSLYKIEVTVTDHAGNTAIDTSDRPFFIVKPNDDSVRTLILWHPDRMNDLGMAAGDPATGNLAIALSDLATNDHVLGRIVDLGGFPGLDIGVGGNLYALWDAAAVGAPTVDAANEILFGAGGIHQVLLDRLAVFTAVEYVILAGGDRVIPLARIADGTVQVSESVYPCDVASDPTCIDPDLDTDGTTVGKALAANQYLSDDPLAFKGTIDLTQADLDLTDAVFVPDLAIGRLVEQPDEIVASIALFISQDGTLDLTSRANKVLVSGYDFLLDAGTRIQDRWTSNLGAGVEGGTLVDPAQGWDSVDLQGLLCPPASDPYAVVSLSGHATHYEAGSPSGDAFVIAGLDTTAIADSCALPGGVVYAVGCHSGLPVPDDGDPDDDHTQDLPQTMLGEGVLAYVANTGYGWGLKHGLGYGERLVEILTDELLAGGGAAVAVGDAVRRTKLRYFVETPRFDVYDEKSLMQWTFFGFPMYAVKTGVSARTASSLRFDGPAPRHETLAARERLGDVVLTRQDVQAKVLPSFLTRLDLTFDFSAASVYKLLNAAGAEVITAGDDDTFCRASGPAPPGSVPKGCYYTLNNVTSGGTDEQTGMTDRPIQPMFIFDSRLSGTSQHGYLWKGGNYVETTDWVPLVAELQSNQDPVDADFFSDHGAAPRSGVGRPGGRRHSGGDVDVCAATDLETTSLVFEAGEVLKASESDPAYDVQRVYRNVDLELFYFNNPDDTAQNCDREGPDIQDGPFAGLYHQVDGNLVTWQVPVCDPVDGPPSTCDPDEVWRVLLVTNDGTTAPDGQGNEIGQWAPLELARIAGTDTWTAELQLAGTGRLTYMVQAVDQRGNVSWVTFQPAAARTVTTAAGRTLYKAGGDPSSGVPLDLPLPVDVAFSPNAADLRVSLTDLPDPVTAAEILGYTIQVTNLSAATASAAHVVQNLPEGVAGVFAVGTGWSCTALGTQVTCDVATLASGPAPSISVFMTAPAVR